MAGTIKVDSINADSNLALKIANTAVAFIDATGLRPVAGNLNLDATATSKLYLPSANTVAIQTAGVTGLSISSSQVVTLANALPVTSGGTGVTTSTGTGAVVLGTSPVLTTPALGTPSALVLTNATGLPQAGLGTNVVGNGPAFLAYPASNQVLSAATWTKITLGNEIFDTNNNFASSRFTPTVAGYYQFNATAGFTSQTAGAGAQAAISFYRNGALYMQGVNLAITGINVLTLSGLIYFNGSSDYVELYCYLNGTSLTINGALEATFFSGALVRSA